MEIEDLNENLNEDNNADVHITGVVFLSTLTWTIAYFSLKKLLPTKSAEYNCRLITFIHGLITSIVGMNQCFLNENPFEHPYWVTNNTQKLLLTISLGYFIFDLTWCSYYRTETALMIVHHICSIYFLRRLLLKNYSGAQATCCLGCMEVTNPFLQLRWFLRSEGYHKTIIYMIVEIIFFVLFATLRIFIGSYVLVKVFMEKNDTEFKIATFLLYSISWMFMIQIVKYVMLKYTSKGDFWKSQMELQSQET